MDHKQYLQILFCLLGLLTVVKFALGSDILSSGQTLADGDIIVSPSQIFELGFFSPGTSKNKFLGVWYKATPEIVVWVANGKNPITDSQGVLTLSKNGTILLTAAQSRIILFSNSSRPTSNPTLQLLDTGNLVLVDKSTNIWQSFDYPTDTRLPGMQMVRDPANAGLNKYLTSWISADNPSSGQFIYRIENNGLSQMIILMGSRKRYRSGTWNGNYFTGLRMYIVPSYSTETVFRHGELISMVENYNESVVTRLTMNYSGFLQRYMMNEQRNAWSLVFELPGDSCDNYGFCGPNGICKINQTPVCECLRGFVPKSQDEWSVFNWTSGCTRTLTLDCQKDDGFLRVEGIKLPDPLNFKLNIGMSTGECHDNCLKNCNCTAYASPYLINENSGCFMWFGDLIDVRDYSTDVTTSPSVYLRLPVSEIGQHTTDSNKKRERLAKFIIAATASGFGVLFLGLCLGGIFFFI